MPRARVLVVEQDKSVRQLIGQALTDKGYEVVEAEDGAKGLQVARPGKTKKSVDVILCNQPDGDDQEPVMQFLEMRPPVPVVLLADHPDLHHATLMFRQGVVDYLVKPLQPQIIVEVVRKALELHGGEK